MSSLVKSPAKVGSSAMRGRVPDAKRRLSESEIANICSVIPPVTAACQSIADHNFAEIRAQMEMQLREIEVKPSKIQTLKAILYNRCMRAQIQPGDTVGLQAAEAISQPTMQMVMNTFHKAGSTEVGNSGLQVISELLNLSKVRKASRAEIHFRNTELSFRDALYLSKAFVAPSVKSLLTDEIMGVSFRMRTVDSADPSHYALFEAFSGVRIPAPTADVPVPYLRLSFDTYRLFEARVSMSDIAMSFQGSSVLCVPSSTSEAILDIFSTAVIPGPSTAEPVRGSAKAGAVKAPAPPLDRRRVVAEALAAVREAKEKETPENTTLEEIARAVPHLTSPTSGFFESSEGAITAKNAPLLFLQTFIAPRIANETFVVSSRVAQKPLAALIPAGSVAPDNTGTSLFRRAEIITTSVSTIMRGATKVDDHTWRIWLDSTKILSLRVPREKAVRLIKAVFPEADVRPELDLYRGSEYIEVRFPVPHPENPHKQITERYSTAAKNHKEELRDALLELARNRDRRALQAQMLKPRPDVVIHGEYVHIRARNVFINTQISVLSRLVTHPAINGRSTITNNFYDIAEVRGIEAARAYVLQEIVEVIANTGSKINPRHMQLVVDVMTSSGSLMPFTPRGSVLRQQNGAYSDSSFDRAPEAFRRSAIIGAPEAVSATSASILLGTVPTFGTGTFRIIAPGGYVPPAYLTAALAEASQSPTVRTLADAPINVASLSMTDSRLTENEAATLVGTSTHAPPYAMDALYDAGFQPSGGILQFNPNVHPPRGVDATYGTLSDREALGLFSNFPF